MNESTEAQGRNKICSGLCFCCHGEALPGMVRREVPRGRAQASGQSHLERDRRDWPMSAPHMASGHLNRMVLRTPLQLRRGLTCSGPAPDDSRAHQAPIPL